MESTYCKPAKTNFYLEIVLIKPNEQENRFRFCKLFTKVLTPRKTFSYHTEGA